MYYVLAFFVGLLQGGICLFLLMMDRHRRVKVREVEIAKQKLDLVRQATELREKAHAREQDFTRRVTELHERIKAKDSELAQRAIDIQHQYEKGTEDLRLAELAWQDKTRAKEADLLARVAKLQEERREFSKQAIAYEELKGENALLKRDLQNLDINLNKLQLDVELQSQKQEQLDQRGIELAERYLKETLKRSEQH